MSNQSGSGHWVQDALIALALSSVIAGLMTAYECRVGTPDQCMISKGLMPYYGFASLLLTWPLVAIMSAAIRNYRGRFRP